MLPACDGETLPKVPLGRVVGTVGTYQDFELDEENDQIPGPDTGWPEGYRKYIYYVEVTNVGDDGNCIFTALIEGDVRGDKSIAQNIYLNKGEEKEISYWWFVKGSITSIEAVAVNLTGLP